MIDFDPFGQPLREVELEDLDRLSEENISEGVYMEYKRSLPNTQSVAKVIGSFANTHGGFFIVGVAEDELTNIASGQIGVNIEDNPNPKETIRNIVRDHLNPSPNFTTRVIQRQDYENYAILLIEIPESHSTPHILSSGRIYTRTGEGSDPISPETDRWTIDKLYERRDEWHDRVDRFCQSGLSLTQGQAGNTDYQADGWPFLEVYGIPSTLGNPTCTEVLENIELFKSIIENSDIYLPEFGDIDSEDVNISGGREYSAYRASSDAVVAQQLFRNESGQVDPASTPETVKFFEDGGLKAFLGIPLLEPPDTLGGSWRRFQQKTDGNIEYIRFIDSSQVLVNLYLLLNSYLNLLEECGWKTDSARNLHFKARTRHGYRTALMFDEIWYSQFIGQFGPPISYEDTVEIPRTGTRALYSEEGDEFYGIMRCIIRVMEAFGLPWEEAGRSPEHLWNRLYDMIDSDNPQ